METTINGIEYSFSSRGAAGGAFILYPTNEHTARDITIATVRIYSCYDVTNLRVANGRDLDNRFEEMIWELDEIPVVGSDHLIIDRKLLHNERKAGKTPLEFYELHLRPQLENK